MFSTSNFTKFIFAWEKKETLKCVQVKFKAFRIASFCFSCSLVIEQSPRFKGKVCEWATIYSAMFSHKICPENVTKRKCRVQYYCTRQFRLVTFFGQNLWLNFAVFVFRTGKGWNIQTRNLLNKQQTFLHQFTYDVFIPKPLTLKQ